MGQTGSGQTWVRRSWLDEVGELYYECTSGAIKSQLIKQRTVKLASKLCVTCVSHEISLLSQLSIATLYQIKVHEPPIQEASDVMAYLSIYSLLYNSSIAVISQILD